MNDEILRISTICNRRVDRNWANRCFLSMVLEISSDAERLLATCGHLRNFLRSLKVVEQKDKNMIRQVILPYLDRQIAAAEKKNG